MEQSETLEPRIRPLTEADRARLRRLAGELVAYRQTVRRGTWIALAAVLLALWIVTLLASDAPAVWVTLAWLAIGAVLALWLGHDLRSQTAHVRSVAASMESALERGEAASYDIVARAYTEFEEAEDEGACWAFDLGDGRIVFVIGQEYYREDGFPSHDFSLVQPLDESGRPAHEWIEKRGEAMPPARAIPAGVKWELADGIPGHLGVVRAELERLEEVLAERA
ncbi:MAG TPA: hypothetical protein VLA33_08815 [Gemmatimonadota bacterium]|nr:hypothetical protein [Gemmatimonadota bacterium]